MSAILPPYESDSPLDYDVLPQSPINEWVVAELPQQDLSHVIHYRQRSEELIAKTGLVVREAQDYEDVGEIVSILNDVFQPESTSGSYYPPGLVRNLLVAGAPMLIAEDPSEGKPVACALSIPSWKKTEPMLQTGPMAVLPEWQRKGVGVALKYTQAYTALTRGVRYLSWSFDPVSAHKAKMHIEKLPTQVSGYIPGVHIRPGLLIPDYPDDRIQVLWDLYNLTPRKLPSLPWKSVDSRGLKNLSQLLVESSESGRLQHPLSLTLPAEVELWKQTDPILALHYYRRMRLLFTSAVDNEWDVYYTNGTYYFAQPSLSP